MYNVREKNLLKVASALDQLTYDDGSIIKLAQAVVDEKDDEAARSLCAILADFVHCDSEQIIRVAQGLKNALIVHYGYLKVSDICRSGGSAKEELEEKSLDELLAELNGLVGLENVKNTVNDLIAYQIVQRLRRSRGLQVSKRTLHMSFTGNPGTGKTTVARIVGRIYKQLGLLSKGHFREVSRTDLIAGYQGQTALKVKKVIDSARGGVLFIDEAYSITENDHSDSYGRECLTELTKALENYRDDLVVIVAGYSEPMEVFFNSNPGLKSRFNTFINFDDYSADELIKILEHMATDNDYTISQDLQLKLRDYFESCLRNDKSSFANGRLARNIYDDLVMSHARRVVHKTNPSEADLMVLLPEDFS